MNKYTSAAIQAVLLTTSVVAFGFAAVLTAV